MPWSEANQAKYDVVCERYSSDFSDAELAFLDTALLNQLQSAYVTRRDYARLARRRAIPIHPALFIGHESAYGSPVARQIPVRRDELEIIDGR